MGSKQEKTETTTIKGIGGQEQRARDIMEQLASSGAGQMGDLSKLARGDLSLSPEDVALLRQIQELSGKSARNQIQQNYEMMAGDVEGRLLDKNMGGASIEAVSHALLGRQLQSSLDESAIQGQIGTAQQMRQHALDRGGLQLNANQLLLQQILGSAGGLADMGLRERMVQTNRKATQETSGAGAVAGQLGQLGGLALAGMTGGASTAVTAGMSGLGAYNAMSSPYLTTDQYGD